MTRKPNGSFQKAWKGLAQSLVEVKIVIVTHGHGDHYGGANYFARKYKSRIVASDVDWTMMEFKGWSSTIRSGASRQEERVCRRGRHGQAWRILPSISITPGHTMGTISPMFDVVVGFRKHRALLWGGTAFNFGKKCYWMQAYVQSTSRIREIASKQGVDVLLSNHSDYDRAVDKLASKASGGPILLLQGTQTVQRALTVMNECGQATLASGNDRSRSPTQVSVSGWRHLAYGRDGQAGQMQVPPPPSISLEATASPPSTAAWVAGSREKTPFAL